MPEKERLSTDSVTGRVRHVEKVEPLPVPEIYANHVLVVANNIDFGLQFGSIVAIKQPDTVQVAPKLIVTITPEVAKMLMVQLSGAIANYEKQVRPIPFDVRIAPPEQLSAPPVETPSISSK